MLRTILALTAASCFAAGLSAQTLDGRLTNQADGTPIPDALVVLLDSTGTAVARGATTSSGGFRLTAPHSGRVTLQVLRIGFRRWDSAPLELSAAAIERRTFAVPANAVVLPTVVVATRRRDCEVRPNDQEAAAILLDEAAKTLELADETLSRSQLRFHTVSRLVELGPDLTPQRLLNRSEGALTGWPVASAPVSSLKEHGFVQEPTTKHRIGADAGPTYYGPDPNVLLSPWFRDTYCLEAVPPRPDQPDLVGVHFEPQHHRHGPDLVGTLWLDQKTFELRVLEFEFDNLGRWVPAHTAGGRLEFRHLSQGGFVTGRWAMRVPIASEAVAVRNVKLHGYLEMDGAITQIRSRDDSVLTQLADLPRIAIADRPAPNQPPAIGPAEGPIRLHQRNATGAPGRIVSAQNTGGWPVKLTEIRIRKCDNIGPGCGTHKVDIIIPPGATLDLLTVRPMRAENAYRFAVGYSWEEIH